jgi:hypothetical protein
MKKTPLELACSDKIRKKILDTLKSLNNYSSADVSDVEPRLEVKQSDVYINKLGNIQYPKIYDDIEPPMRNNLVKTPTKKKRPYVPMMPE